jgi:hypothetical protein
MDKWEYIAVEMAPHMNREGLQYHLNETGRRGWELVTVMWGSVAVFKRRTPDAE